MQKKDGGFFGIIDHNCNNNEEHRELESVSVTYQCLTLWVLNDFVHSHFIPVLFFKIQYKWHIQQQTDVDVYNDDFKSAL